MELVVLIVFVMALIAQVRISSLSNQIKALTNRLSKIEDEPSPGIDPAQSPRSETIKPGESVYPVPGMKSRVKKSRTKTEWEALIGGKILNRIGAVAIILGAGFFLKTAFDYTWFTDTIRVLIVAIYGGILIYFGRRLHHKGITIFAQGLLGTGISVLYVSVFASYNYYHLIPQLIAFLLTLSVTAIAYYLAIKYDTLAIAVLAWFGGFLSPVILTIQHTSNFNLFMYLTLLALGTLAITYRKEKWFILEPLSLLGVYINAIYWHLTVYHKTQFWASFAFLTAVWIIFYLSDVGSIIKKRVSYFSHRRSVAMLNIVAYFIFIYRLIHYAHPKWESGVALILALVYFSGGFLSKKLWPAKGQILQAYQLVTAIILLVIATTLEFTGFKVIFFWAIEASLLIFLGIRFHSNVVIKTALSLFGLAIFRLLLLEKYNCYEHAKCFTLLINWRDASSLSLILGLAFSQNQFDRLKTESFKRIGSMLTWTWSILLFIFLTFEAKDCYQHNLLSVVVHWKGYELSARSLFLGLIWLAYSQPMVFWGLKKSKMPMTICGLAAYLVPVIVVLDQMFQTYSPIQSYLPVLNFRAITMILVIIGGGFILSELIKSRDRNNLFPIALESVRYMIILLIFSLITSEIVTVFHHKIFILKELANRDHLSVQTQIHILKNQQQLFLSGGWLLYGVALLIIGIVRHKQYLRIVAMAVFGITGIKIFIFDLSYLETGYRFLAFLGLGIILMIVSYLYQKYKAYIFKESNS